MEKLNSQTESKAKVRLINQLFGTNPIVVHANGELKNTLVWPKIQETLFTGPKLQIGAVPNLTVLTCNNGCQTMGLLERSAAELGIPCLVRGQGIPQWINSRDKPSILVKALSEITTEYVLYADSRDAVLLAAPHSAIAALEARPGCDLLFGGDRVSWPALDAFHKFESSLPGAADSQFRYLNGGTWIGRRSFCLDFYSAAMRIAPVREAPNSEQGILRQLLPRFYPQAQIDYRCEVFQNIGFLFADVLEVVTCPPSNDSERKV